MALSIGIVGLPNVGKSTLFNALTGASVLTANYPFATIDPNTGVVPIPDERIERLGELFNSEKVTHASVTFVDIAGLVSGASEGEGLGNRFLANIREVSAICHVVRAFDSENVAHVDEAADPAGDIATIETELALADLETIDRRLPRLQKESAAGKASVERVRLLEELRKLVARGEMVSGNPELMARRHEFRDLQLLTAKPVIYVFNCDESTLANHDRMVALERLVAPADALFLDAQIESELVDLDPAERIELLASIGQEEPGLNAL
ncbi:MAG: redox-regulated ATPase YchF, partial [Acidimicrobiia bacterium]